MGWVLSKYEYNDIFYATSLLHFDVFFYSVRVYLIVC